MRRHICLTAIPTVALILAAAGSAQEPGVDTELLRVVMPAAGRFGPIGGEPPVIRAFATDSATGTESLIGYVFLTSDVPPEEEGYNGPIEVLVGMDLEGRLTGVRVVDYYESLRSSRGDFLRRRGFQEQFQGKLLADPFRVRRDVDGITGATITVAAMSRGIRSAARRVAAAYLREERRAIEPGDVERLSWPELVDRGIGDRIEVVDDGLLRIEVSLVPLRDEAMGRTLMGAAVFDTALARAGARALERRLWMVGVDGGLEALFRATALSLLQGADTLRFATSDLVLLGPPRSGKVDGQFRNVGLLLVDPAVDADQPFTWILRFGGGMGPYTALHRGEARPPATPPPIDLEPEPAPPTAAAPGDPAVGRALPEAETAAVRAADRAGAPVAAGGAGPAGSVAAPRQDPVALDFAGEAEETVLQRTLDQTSWLRFGLLAALLALSLAAFLGKKPALRRVTLGGTLVLLGFGGVGFLSVSHITSAIDVGPGLFLTDLPLLLFVGFTVATTLLWGRVFCGYLCPFGALQDVLARLVPSRFRRELPRPLHERALLVKYAVLAAVVLPVAWGSELTLFQYVEPFGTVFFFSSSIVLWAIALALLAAAAIVPRFYCRYVCPLGASLAVASVVSPFRIRRVEQCTVCKVCEQDCPTGAIAGPAIDFKECVRCNACEVNLIERVGVCRHDMEEVRARLVHIELVGRRQVARGR